MFSCVIINKLIWHQHLRYLLIFTIHDSYFDRNTAKTTYKYKAQTVSKTSEKSVNKNKWTKIQIKQCCSSTEMKQSKVRDIALFAICAHVVSCPAIWFVSTKAPFYIVLSLHCMLSLAFFLVLLAHPLQHLHTLSEWIAALSRSGETDLSSVTFFSVTFPSGFQLLIHNFHIHRRATNCNFKKMI